MKVQPNGPPSLPPLREAMSTAAKTSLNWPLVLAVTLAAAAAGAAVTYTETPGLFLVLLAATGFCVILLSNLRAGVIALLLARTTLDVWNSVSILPVDIGSRYDRLNIATSLSVVLLAVGTLSLAAQRKPIPKHPVALWYVLFLTVGLVSAFNSGAVLTTLVEWFRALSGFLLFLLVISYFQSSLWRNRLLTAILISSIVPSVAAAYQGITGSGDTSISGFNRVYGTFVHPNNLGQYLVFLLPFVIWRTESGPTLWRLLGRLFILPAMAVLLIATFSRGAWFGAVAVLLVLGALRSRRHILLLLLVLPLLLWLDPFLIVDRLSAATTPDSSTNSLISRTYAWEVAIRAWASSPLIGHGFGTFADVMAAAYGAGFKAHNDYLRLLAETGAMGLATFLLLVLSIMREAFRLHRTGAGNDSRALAACFLSSMSALLLMALADNVFISPVLQWYVWAVGGLVYLHRRDKSLHSPGLNPGQNG